MAEKITIWHNPRCSKSRASYNLLKEHLGEFETREYLKDPPTHQELKKLLKMLGMKPRELMRKNEKIYKELKLKDESDEQKLIDAMVKNPRLIERPIVIKADTAVLGRPTEKVAELLGLNVGAG